MTDHFAVRPVLQNRSLRLPLAFASGLAMALGTAPFDLWYVAFFGLVGAFVLFRAFPAAATGWMVGLGYFGLGLAWIIEPFMVDAAVTGWMAPFGLFGLAGGLALFWALAFWGAAQVPRAGSGALVIMWGAAEFSRAYVLTGFPWGLVGYLWAPTDAIQWVAVIGPHGLTMVSLGVAALCAAALGQAPQRLPAAGAAVAAGAALLGGGSMLMPDLQDLEGRPQVRLIQPNAAQHEKWDPELIPVFFERQLQLTSALPAEGAPVPDLVIWPEIALPMVLHSAADAFVEMDRAAGPAKLIVGLQRADAGRYFNSMAVMEGDGTVSQVYDKHHLVPFGEYMPAASFFAKFDIMGLAARAEGGYAAGPGPALLDLGELGRAVPLICYEAVFPQDVRGAPRGADMLLQITNDAWFGAWSGPYQHLMQARIRAIEHGIPMLRSANTGVSAVIDGAGRILAHLPLGEAGFVDAPLPPPLRVTLYTRIGDWPVLLLLISALTVLCLRFRKSD